MCVKCAHVVTHANTHTHTSAHLHAIIHTLAHLLLKMLCFIQRSSVQLLLLKNCAAHATTARLNAVEQPRVPIMARNIGTIGPLMASVHTPWYAFHVCHCVTRSLCTRAMRRLGSNNGIHGSSSMCPCGCATDSTSMRGQISFAMNSCIQAEPTQT